MAHFARLGVLRAIEPGFGALRVLKLQNDDAFRLPIAFQRFAGAAADNVFSAILRHCRARALFVFFVADGIGDVDFDDDVGWHVLRCCQSLAARNDKAYRVGERRSEKFRRHAADDCTQAACAPQTEARVAKI